ncbi:MAG TPA: nicotinate phosphoribosyltransferase [Blastocatellia bacterium]|nr:nicotinate phosphoribosyltransferase [Blastocatellia bacterium]
MNHIQGTATDLYQLTMAAGYHAHRRTEEASFELFVRRLPPHRSYLVIAGLAQAVEYLRELRFSDEEIAYLQSLAVFQHVSQDFFAYLRDFRFSGDVWAMPEGTVAFAGEPLLRVTAPLIEAQILETWLLSTINFQTLIASKAARIVDAAQGRAIVEFGARRAHGMEAAFYAARAAFIGGCIGTSNVEAGMRFGIPVYGTAAHSWVMSFDREYDAFRAFHEIFPEHTTLLLDTYDTIAAAKLATEIGPSLRGVRLDSGDLCALSKQVRAILDQAGMQNTRIMASGDLDEFKITELLAKGAPIDLFGVGTELSTSRDDPALGGVYKLVQLDGQPKMKLSQDKATYPYCKQVWRSYADDGTFLGDTIGIADEGDLPGEPLLQPVLRKGETIAPPSLTETQAYARQQVRNLPEIYRTLTMPQLYPVKYSKHLESNKRKLLASRLQRHKLHF